METNGFSGPDEEKEVALLRVLMSVCKTFIFVVLLATISSCFVCRLPGKSFRRRANQNDSPITYHNFTIHRKWRF